MTFREYRQKWSPTPFLSKLIIEILGAQLEEACLKKGKKNFQLISTLFCEVKRGFAGPWKIVTLKQITLAGVEISQFLTRCSFTKKNLQDLCKHTYSMKRTRNYYHGEKYTKNLGYFCNFEKNRHSPIGENSPNLVTLVFFQPKLFCLLKNFLPEIPILLPRLLSFFQTFVVFYKQWQVFWSMLWNWKIFFVEMLFFVPKISQGFLRREQICFHAGLWKL
jgi:hypothetical protein